MVTRYVARWRLWWPVACALWAVGWLWGEPVAAAAVGTLVAVGVSLALRSPLLGALVVLVAEIVVLLLGGPHDNPAALAAGLTVTYLLGYEVPLARATPVVLGFFAVVIWSDLPPSGHVIGVGFQLVVYLFGHAVRRAGAAAAAARRDSLRWVEVDLEERAKELAAAECERLEVEALDAMRHSVRRMRRLAAASHGRVDVDALQAIRAHAHATVGDLRTLLVTLRGPIPASGPAGPPASAPTTVWPAPDDVPRRRPAPPWRADLLVAASVVVLAVIDLLLLVEGLPSTPPAYAWIGLMACLALPLRRTAPASACALASLPYAVALALGIELLYGLAALVTFGLLTWSVVAVVRGRARAMVAWVVLAALVLVSPTYSPGVYPLVTLSVFVMTAVVSGAWHQREWARVRAEHEVGRYEDMLRRQVDSALVDARCGLARELHDAVSRTVAAAAVQADAALALAPVDPERALRAAEEVGNAVARAEDELRRLRSVLRNDTSESGQHPGIGVSWRPMILEARAAGLQIKGWIDPRIDQESVDPQAREVARQLVAEALTNAAKYAPGARVVVRLEWTPDGVEVSVVDREGGAVDARNRAPGTGFGLLSQAERVEALGGRFTTSRTADGFAVYALVPPNPAPREDAVV